MILKLRWLIITMVINYAWVFFHDNDGKLIDQAQFRFEDTFTCIC
jgi:hypothetical protein